MAIQDTDSAQLTGVLSHLSVKLGCGVITMNEQEKLS
jgi:hypothetical protein